VALWLHRAAGLVGGAAKSECSREEPL